MKFGQKFGQRLGNKLGWWIFNGPIVGPLMDWYFQRQINKGMTFNEAVEKTASVFASATVAIFMACVYAAYTAIMWVLFGTQLAIAVLAVICAYTIIYITFRSISKRWKKARGL